MITFFKIIDPIRALALFGILLALALLQWTVFPLGQLQVELGWQLLGKRILEGQTLYVGVVDDTAPLSALVFTLLQWLFPAQVWPHRLIALLLIFAQANYLNSLLVRYGAFELNTYVPALTAIVIYAFNAEFLLLSPMLMGSFFLLLALGQLFSQTVLQEESLSSTTLLGVYAGMAACFHLPFLVFLPFFLIAGITISGFTFNQVLLTLVNFFLPLGLLALYYFWIDALPSFYHEFLLGTRIKDVYNHLSLFQALMVLAVPLFFAILGFTIGSVKQSYTVNQQKQKQLMLLYLFFGVATILLSNHISAMEWLVVVPALAYFATKPLLFISSNRWRTGIAVAFFLVLPLSGLAFNYYMENTARNVLYTVNRSEKLSALQGKTLWVLGDDMSPYAYGKIATPFLNYKVSSRILEANSPFAIIRIESAIRSEMPELILDSEGRFEKLMYHIPWLQNRYASAGAGIYQRKD